MKKKLIAAIVLLFSFFGFYFLKTRQKLITHHKKNIIE